MNELYVLVDIKINLIISPLLNYSTWGNIWRKHLSEEKLSDLEWAVKVLVGDV